ncbi:MAG: hypothetical protein JSS51_11140 [Planctomycetes bacterium]|nr:hypothetical protein [Planctomycetota bacterium]
MNRPARRLGSYGDPNALLDAQNERRQGHNGARSGSLDRLTGVECRSTLVHLRRNCDCVCWEVVGRRDRFLGVWPRGGNIRFQGQILARMDLVLSAAVTRFCTELAYQVRTGEFHAGAVVLRNAEHETGRKHKRKAHEQGTEPNGER